MWKKSFLFILILFATLNVFASNDRYPQNALPEKLITLVAIIGAIIAMLGGLYFVFARLKSQSKGFGPNSLKALGLVLFLPTLLIVSLTVANFQTETLAALLGTVAGYVLSNSKGDES